MIDHGSDRPVFRQLADIIREQIRSGELAPGAKLPSEPELERTYDISRTTVRAGLDILESEGLTVTERGKGRTVRQNAAVVRRAGERYRFEQGGAGVSFTYDQSLGWDDYRLETDFAVVGAAPGIAESFGVTPGTPLLGREFVFYTGRGPARQTLMSYLLHRQVTGTPIVDPKNEPWPGGTIAQLATVGVKVTDVREDVTARMPTPEETALMRIPPGSPVFAVRRVMYAGTAPVEVADIVIPCSAVVLSYDIGLT